MGQPKEDSDQGRCSCACGGDPAMADPHTATHGEPLQGKWIFLKKTQPIRTAGSPEGLQAVGLPCWSTGKVRRKEQEEETTWC